MEESLRGKRAPLDAVTLADGTDLLAEWQERGKIIEQALGHTTGEVPWREFDPATLRWYVHHLGVSGDDEQEVHRVIRERLLDGRSRLEPREIQQLVLLFGREDVVRRALHRNLLDCRARTSADRRWDERVESAENVLQSLKLAIEFFGRHVGIDGVTLDGLRATSGSADYIAMRECLVNLFIHQDYGDGRTAGQIEIAPDRAMFFNAGKSLVDDPALAEGGRSQSRNPLINRALRLIGFAELAGSGLREVQQAWREARRRPPVITSDTTDNTFTLTLDWRSAPDTSDAFWREKLGVTLSSPEAQALGLSADPNGVTINQIAAAQGLLIDDAHALAQGLVKKGLVQERDGVIYIQDHLKPLVEQSQAP